MASYEFAQTVLTYAYDLILGGSALYFGVGFVLFADERVTQKRLQKATLPALPAATNPPLEIPLTLKETVKETLAIDSPLNLDRSPTIEPPKGEPLKSIESPIPDASSQQE